MSVPTQPPSTLPLAVTQTKAFITGVADVALSPAERAFLARERPAGLILFSRNCRSREQIRRLVDEFCNAVGTDSLLVLVDQEGGRVQRLRPPLARLLPPAWTFGELWQQDPDAAIRAARLVARLAAFDLKPLGINTSCAPVLDLPVAGAHAIIGDRAYGTTPEAVVALGGGIADGLISGGVLPVMKHMPGHGRAETDSHLELPVVTTGASELDARDFEPFRRLSKLPAAMTAHVIYTALDPAHPASTSATVHAAIRCRIGFDGLLMSDDLSMNALSGLMASRAAAVLAAGSDLALHCNGSLAEMEAVAAASPELTGKALSRYERALAVTGRCSEPFDVAEAEAVLARLLGASA